MRIVGLSKRDRSALTLCALFLVVFIVIKVIYMPAAGRRDALEKRSQSEKGQLKEMVLMQGQYQRISHNVEREKAVMKKRGQDFSLFSFLDDQAERIGVKGNVVYMNPTFIEIENQPFQKVYVKVKLESLYLRECVDFLDSIEKPSKGVYVNSLSLTGRGEENRGLDMIVETETIIPEGS